MKGKFYESEYEKALIDLLQAEGWQYTNGGNIHRQLREPLLIEDPKVNDLRVYLQNQYPDLADSDVTEVINYLRHVPGQSHFERLRNTFQLVRDGYRYTRHGDGVNFDIRFIDFGQYRLQYLPCCQSVRGCLWHEKRCAYSRCVAFCQWHTALHL